MKETGVEYYSTDPAFQAKCCCWSPKGKQIVAGFGNGKIAQFNMELKPARIIECPPGVFTASGTFETIAVQWLSTYQFAIALSSQQEETRPGEPFFLSASINYWKFFYKIHFIAYFDKLLPHP